MWRIWMMFDPRRALIALTTFLFVLVFLLHSIVLSSPRYNLFEDGTSGAQVSSEVATERVASTAIRPRDSLI